MRESRKPKAKALLCSLVQTALARHRASLKPRSNNRLGQMLRAYYFVAQIL